MCSTIVIQVRSNNCFIYGQSIQHIHLHIDIETKLIGRAQGDSYESLKSILDARLETIKASKWKGESETMTSLCLEWPGLAPSELPVLENSDVNRGSFASSPVRIPGLNIDLGNLLPSLFLAHPSHSPLPSKNNLSNLLMYGT